MNENEQNINALNELTIGLTNETKELFKEARELFNFLDSVSQEIYRIESILQELSISFEYETVICSDFDEVEFFAWKFDDKSKRWRLIYKTVINPDFLLSEEQQGINEKPFSECKTDIRIRNARYLPMFIKEFTQFINSKNIELRKTLQLKDK